jgi:large subunit ribosomal protein L28
VRADDFFGPGVVGYSLGVALAGFPLRHPRRQRYSGVPMAAVCDICAKKPGFGHNRPWSRKITNRRFNPNIQRVRAVVNGTPKRMNVCTGCIKAGKVSR